jgi:hypothetical protein
LGHSARSASRRRRPRHGCGAPRRLGRRRASGAPHPASSPCECTPTRSARTCMSGLGAPARRCPPLPDPEARGRGDTGAFIANLARVGRVDVRRRTRPPSWAVEGSGDRRIRGVGLPPREASSGWGRAPPFRAGRTSTGAEALRARVRATQERVGAATTPRPWAGSGVAARRPDDPRQARVCAQPGASRVARGLEPLTRSGSPASRDRSRQAAR